HSQFARETGILHRAEEWRDALIADDDRLNQWLQDYPETNTQHLRALIRQARKEANAEARRQGRAFRLIFALVRAQLSS
ncbi:MAG: DUF615 domain-containing protein, partial [Gammaproteobacteria bacterium]